MKLQNAGPSAFGPFSPEAPDRYRLSAAGGQEGAGVIKSQGRGLARISEHLGVLPRGAAPEMHRVVLAAADHDAPVRAQYHRHQGSLPLQLLAKLAGGCAEERHLTITGRCQLPYARPSDGADSAGMFIGAPNLRAVRVIHANLPGAGCRQELAVRRPRHVFRPTASGVDGPAYLTFGGVPD